jgi:4-hydroxy-tetrahydrodipicolinate synthase
MTGYAFPEMLVDVVEKSRAGDRDSAHDIFDAHLPLVRYEQQPSLGLAVRKYILKLRGVVASDVQRSPYAKLSAAAIREVEYLLARLGKSDSRFQLETIENRSLS